MKNTLDMYKQMDSLILKQGNVKELVRYVATTEKGELNLVFDLESQEYFFTLGGDKFLTDSKNLKAKIPEILEHSYKSMKKFDFKNNQ